MNIFESSFVHFLPAHLVTKYIHFAHSWYFFESLPGIIVTCYLNDQMNTNKSLKKLYMKRRTNRSDSNYTTSNCDSKFYDKVTCINGIHGKTSAGFVFMYLFFRFNKVQKGASLTNKTWFIDMKWILMNSRWNLMILFRLVFRINLMCWIQFQSSFFLSIFLSEL